MSQKSLTVGEFILYDITSMKIEVYACKIGARRIFIQILNINEINTYQMLIFRQSADLTPL